MAGRVGAGRGANGAPARTVRACRGRGATGARTLAARGSLAAGLLLLAACGEVGRPEAAAGPDEAARIEAVVREVVDRGVVAGASVAVFRGGRPLVVRAFGLADREAGVPATDATLFNLGSVTKVFTAAAVVKLAEAGALGLDDPVGRWMPEVRGRPWADRVTVRQLLNHTSGLPEYVAADLERWERTGEPLTPAFVYRWLEGRTLDYEPGAHWDYTNTGLYLAGRVVEAASGRPWFDYLESEVLGAELREDVRLCDEAQGRRPRGYEMGDGGLEPTPLYLEAGLRGDGGLCATPVAVARFLRALESGEVVSAEGFRRMAAPTELASGLAVDYGLGLRLGALEGHRLWGHTGGHAGFIAAVARYPDQDVTVAVAVNTIRSSEGALVLHGRIAAALLGVETGSPDPIRVEPETLGRYAGRYRGPRGEEPGPLRAVALEDGALVERIEGEEVARRLLPVAPDAFVREADPYPLDRYVFQVRDGVARGYSAYYNGFHQEFWSRVWP